MAQFKLIAPGYCSSARANVGQHVVQQMAHSTTLQRRTRCRQCRAMLEAGERVVAFYHNFTEWNRWMFTAYIHAEPCEAPTMQREPVCQISREYL